MIFLNGWLKNRTVLGHVRVSLRLRADQLERKRLQMFSCRQCLIDRAICEQPSNFQNQRNTFAAWPSWRPRVSRELSVSSLILHLDTSTMSNDIASLKWSTQLSIAPASRTPKLVGDKITLPPSALEALLAAAPVVSIQTRGNQPITSTFDPYNPHTYAAERYAREQLAERQQQLPHPLTFRIVNPRNGRVVHAGIREFSAEDNEIGLSPFLLDALGVVDGAVSNDAQEHVPSGHKSTADPLIGKLLTLTVHAKQLPKGTYVRLRPLEAGYDPEDWKSLLERYLRDNFTTLTNGEILSVQGGRHQQFRFLVDKFEPEGDGICIVDTDLEVDIEALNEEQARETLNKKLAKAQHAPGSIEGSSPGGILGWEVETSGQVLPGEYVDYELKDWNKGQALEIGLDAGVEDANLDLFVSPFSARQRSRPRDDEHVFGDFSHRASKRLRLSSTNVELEDAESIYISVHAYRDEEGSMSEPAHPIPFTLFANPASTEEGIDGAAADEVICKNCRQNIPKRTLPLHEAFCYRNNILCPHCITVFLKNSDTWKNHWHCPHDNSHGNTPSSKRKHDTVFHPPTSIQCPNCDFFATNLPDLAHHRTSLCPDKEILCQFCHLIVPQKGPDDPSFTDAEVLLSGLTPHELADGARTTECHLCNKIVRLRDMKTHLRFHDRERVARPKPRLCRNPLCGRTIKEQDRERVEKEQLGLCGDCFGPLYVTSYDPEGKALRRRIERRLLQQLMAGCGKPWCGNGDACRTGRKNNTGVDESVTAKDALPILKPIMDELAKGGTPELEFCVDELSQTRRVLSSMIAGEGEYELEWCVKALEEEHNNVEKARDWLKDGAPRIGEVLK